MLKLRLVLAALISILPLNILRVLGYRLLGYKIKGRIGFGTVIAVSAAHIEKCKIGLFNLFIGPMAVQIGERASIGDRNTFSCGFWTHGAGVTDRDIRISRDCYLGSAVRFAPGSAVGDNVIVAMGSVVTKKFDVSKAMIGECRRLY